MKSILSVSIIFLRYTLKNIFTKNEIEIYEWYKTRMTTISDKQNIPWVEKYRPTQFENIVLDPLNRQVFKNILEKAYFPNLLFYGPPGTGKTTTIINLINEYQSKYYGKSTGTVIHLNASDERGIDIIRNQISQFVRSKNLFEIGFKFVILDEVDYMTKTAQQALKTLLQTCNNNVRFCLICNYISKIDESLQNEFICIRFNQLPKEEIHHFIKNIANTENLSINDNNILAIQNMYQSDIRSMINFIQLNVDSTSKLETCSPAEKQNEGLDNWKNHIIDNRVWEKIQDFVKKPDSCSQLCQYIHEISRTYNMNKKNIIQSFFDYLLRYHIEQIDIHILDVIENSIHKEHIDIDSLLKYLYYHMLAI